MAARDGQDEERDRRELIVATVLKLIGVALAIGLAIGVATWVVVRGLDLDEADPGAVGPAPVEPVTPLPTTALPVPTDVPTDDPTGLITGSPTASNTGGLFLAASPVLVEPMERINLTGQWPGHDAMGLLVQRKQNGQWADFGVQTQVRVGAFETYVMTGQEGANVFRVYDPETKTASNEVTITVG